MSLFIVISTMQEEKSVSYMLNRKTIQTYMLEISQSFLLRNDSLDVSFTHY